MKIRFLSVPLILSALLTAGCGKTETSGATAATGGSSASPNAASAAPAAKTAGARAFELTANDQMQYKVDGKTSDASGNLTLEAGAGEIKFTLTNAGTLPKEAMGHNFVLLKPGSDPLAFSAAAATAKDTDYIPASLKDQVVAHTQLLGPRKSDEITVKLDAGEYPFLCSFPAHAGVGMRGKLIVK